MRVAFVDESETRSGVFVFAALVATADQISQLTEDLDALVRDIESQYAISRNCELHAHDIFHGLGHWESLPPRARVGLQVRIASAVARSGVTLCMRGVDGPALAERQARSFYPTNFTTEQEAFKHLLQRLQAYAEEKNTKVLVIADERSDRESHRRDLAMHRLEGTPGDYWHTDFDRILDTVHFAPSHHSRMLQAADHYAFFVRRRLEVPRERDERAEATMSKIMSSFGELRSFECGIWRPS